MQRYDSNANMIAQSPRQQQQQLQQRQQSHGSPTQQQQLNDRNAQPSANTYYPTSNQPMNNYQTMMMAGHEHQTSPMAFQWPPNAQNRGMGNGGETTTYGDMSFGSNQYYDTNQANAEIDAILSNYQPKLFADMQQSNGMSKSLSSQAMSNSFQHGSQSGNSSSNSYNNLVPDQLDPATAAAAAYGHVGYGSIGRADDGGTSSGRNDMDSWNSNIPGSQSDNYSSLSGGGAAGLDFTKSYNGKGGNSGTAYDGDASNTSSAQTPGGVSSGDDSNSGKRRRMTVGGGIEAANQQERFEAGMSTGGHDGKGANSNQGVPGRPAMQHHGTSVVDSRSLEKIAKESLQKASQDNSRALSNNANTNRTLTARPAFRHRRSFSGSQVQEGGSSSSSTSIPPMAPATQTLFPQSNSTKKVSSSAVHPPISFASYASSASSSSLQAGHAASHPPGLGSQVLRGADPGTSGVNAATDFTKRKGWPTRIVEELLDFVHVLDRQGKVLFASPSILTLTGWKAEELKGKELTDFVHPDDVLSVRKEFQTCLQNRTNMTMYYRFRRKPQTAADKQKVRDQREAQHVSRSRSGSTSGGDSSSNQDVVNANNKTSTFATGSMDNQFGARRPGYSEEEGDMQDDSREKYVIFEATGHPYISPEGSFPESDLKEEYIEKLLPEVLGTIKEESPPPDKGPNTFMDGQGPLDKGGGGAAANEIQCFFCSCRIYPTKNIGMLDSFLELKLENERLRMLLGELSVSDGPVDGLTGDAGSDGRRSLDDAQHGYHLDYLHDGDQQSYGAHRQNSYGQNTMTPSHFGMSENINFNRKNSLISAGSASNPTSPHLSQPLERTLTGGTSGQGTGGVDESDEETSPNPSSLPDEKKKKKKPKPEDGDYVCTDCGRVDSPEWRKGPLGPKTLCNACGLRWAKKVKRNGGDPNAIAMAARPAKGQIKAQAAAARAQKQNIQYQKDNGDLTQIGPPPLPPSNSTSSSTYMAQQPQSSPTFYGNMFGDGSMNQMNNHDYLSSTGMGYNPNLEHMGHTEYNHQN